MRNKLILFLMLALFGSATFLRADEVTIGDPAGTTGNSYLPMYSLYNYSFTQQIYTASEIGFASGGTINSITLWLKTTSSVPTRNFEIYMAETTVDEFATVTDWIPMSTTDMVYSGSITPSSDFAPYVFTLSTPFDYNGGNLVITFRDMTGTWSGGFSGLIYGDASDTYRAMYVYRDASAYDIAAPGANGSRTGQKNVIKINITPGSMPPPPPPTPTGELAVTPNPLLMGDMPTIANGMNVWTAPFTVRIANGGPESHVEAVISNTSGLNPFTLSEPVNLDLPTDEAIEVTINIDPTLPDGLYEEELEVAYTENAKSFIQVPLKATFYTPVQGDVVEWPLSCDPTSAPSLNPTGMFANYNLKDMLANEKFVDAVYTFTLAQDGTFHADMSVPGYIYVFNYEDPATFHPTAALEPVVYVKNDVIDRMLVQGDYYLIVAAEELNTATINLNATLITTPPTALTNIAPANSANEVTAPVTLEWTNDPDATQYQVYFGTTYPPALVLDWTMIENINGTYVIDALDNNTQYFWQIKNKNSLGEISGELWGFTTPLQPPTNVRATETEIFTDESTLIKWNGFTTGGFNGEVTVADGTETNYYIPVYGLWVDDYTRSEMIYPESMLTDMIGGEITSLKFYLSTPASAPWAPAVFNVYMKEVTSTTLSDAYLGSADATIVYTGALDGTGSIMTIALTTPYVYNGGNLLLGIEETTVGTYKSAYFYGITSTGSSASGYSSASLSAVTFTQRDFLPKTTFVCGTGNSKNMVDNRSFRGYNVYYSGIKANTELITERQYLLENLPYAMPGGHEIHVTNVFDEGESPYDAGSVIVYVSGYGYLQGDVTELNSGDPMANVTLSFAGKDEFDNDVTYTATTDAMGHYEVKVKDGVYNRAIASLDGFQEAYGNPLPATVTELNYTTVDFVMHEVYKPVYKVYAQELEPATAKVTWSIYNFVPGVGGVTMGDEFNENFDNSTMPAGWTTLDADGDGYNWALGSVVMSTGYGHNGSNDMILSQSYSNSAGILYPDNYLITPQVTIGSTSTFSFWACAQDASYAAEHYGVAVSTTGTAAADFTMLDEWTMTAKNDGTAKGPRGTNAQGTWYQKTIDLSAYAGQQVYIAIRHFNCHDMFYLDVDDISLSNATKAESTRALDHYTVVRKAVLKETPIVLPDDSVYLATLTDTLYADFDWDNLEAGLYQYGVRTVYPGGDPMKGNRADDELTVHDGTVTNSYVPVYGFYADAYLRCQFVVEESLLGAMMGSTINSMTFYLSSPASDSWGAANWQVYMKPFSSTTIAGFEDPSTATVVYNGPLDGTQPTMTVTFSTPYTYTGGNLLIGIDNTNPGSYKSSSFYGEEVSGACVQGYSYSSLSSISPTQRNFVPKTTFHYDAAAGGAVDDPTTTFTWSNILPKNMDASLTVNAVTTTGTVEGAQVKIENMNADAFGENYVFEAELGENGEITFDAFRKGQYKVSVLLDGFVSEYDETVVEFWNDADTITAHFVEDFAPVNTLTVSGTGYARWTNMLPATDVPERYIVKLNEVFQGETTANYMQLDVTGLEAGHTYDAAVALIYTTGMSPWTYATFTYLGCDAVTTDVDTLWIEWNEEQHMDVVLNWNEGTSPTPPPPPTGDVTIVLTADDVWGDGSGYQMLLDETHSLYGSTIPTSGALSLNCTGNEAIYAQFSHKIPTNADGNCSTSNMVNNNTVSITIPAGTYDWCITNPTPGDRIWIASSGGSIGGRYDDYTFEANHTYTFHVYFGGANDATDLTITGGKGMQPKMAVESDDCKNIKDVVKLEKVAGNFSAAGQGFGQAATDNRAGNWYYYDNGVNEDAIGTGGGNFYWGVMFPAGSYDGTQVTKVAAYDYIPMTGTVTIYNDGTTAPLTAVGSMNVTFTGAEDFVEFTFDTPVTIDPTKNVWVVFYNASGATYPAAVCSNTGDPNGRWVSLDGVTWEDLTSYSLNYTFMVRAYIETGGGAPAGASNITPNKFNILVDGQVVGATSDNTFTVTAEDYVEHCYEVVYVDGDYNFSCGQMICFTVPLTDVNSYDVVNRIYPNPTSGDLHIEANDMIRISVVNALGQVVYDAKVSGNETVLNMSRFNSGVYMVGVVTKNGTSVKRVVVTK